jgi:DNA-directed RNA polymerase subunit omega
MARITVEDCLQQVQSRFILVHLASQRARDLMKGAPALVQSENKSVVTALREVAAGKVKMVPKSSRNKHELSEGE